jgi:iron complex transport system substrate-binding protein
MVPENFKFLPGVVLGQLFLVLAFAGMGCRTVKPTTGNQQPEATRRHRDGIGREVSIPIRPKRIISLAPNLTEILFALGLEESIIGVTTYCDFPAAALARERVGDTITPNVERIIALKPDLVVVTTSSQLERLTRQLDSLSIPVYVTNPRTVREVAATIRQLGEVTGHGLRASELAAEMEGRIRRVEERVARLPRVRVLYLLQMDPLIVPGRQTFLNDLINLAGGESISGGEEADYPQFSRESVLVRAPEVILLPSGHGEGWVDEGGLRRLLSRSPAVQANRVLKVEADLVDRPGPRIVDGLEQVAQALHPESP